MVSVYFIDLKEITPDLILKYESLLSEADKRRYQCMTSQTRKLQFLVGRALILNKCHQSPDLLENGKPIVQKGYISLSHSGNMVALAVSAYPVGLDVEEMVLRTDYEKIAERLNFQLSNNKTNSFYEGVTCYEATYKLGSMQRPYISYKDVDNYKVCIASVVPNQPVDLIKENLIYL